MADNILVVEYEPRYADRVRQALTGHPWVPSFAKDGEEALRILQVQRPSLIVVSSVLPKVSAPDLIRAIRSEPGLHGTKILLTVAGYKGTSPTIDAQRLGASDILPKPYSETEFLSKVRQMLGTSGESDRAAVATDAEVVRATEPPPPAQAPPPQAPLAQMPRAQAPPAQAPPPTAPAARPAARPTADVDKLVADTLAGLMKQPRPAPAESKPKTHSGTTGLDRKVQDTLSGLEKSARRTPAPAAVATPPPPEEEAADAEDQNDNIVVSQPVIAAAEPAPPEPESADDFAGDEALDGVKFGPYVLLEKIATGGMAEVWKARRRGVEGFQKIVAIKKILPHLSDNEEFIAMFVDEAKLAAQLNHSNIIHIYDLGKAEGSYYIAMEFVDGADLKTILRRGEDHGQPLTIELSLFIASKIAAALEFAHRKRDFEDHELGIVHRDVSPQNVLISVDGDIKLCDFGIAKAASKASHTQAGALKGKLQYMAPEQAWGRAIDRRTDVFALAVVLFEMLAGRKLFDGDNEMSLLDQVRQPSPVPPSNFNDEVPAEVDAIVLKALESEPERRYQTAGDMARDIDRVLYSLRPTPTAADLAIYMHHIAEPLPAARPAAVFEPEPVEAKPAAPEPAPKAAPVPQTAASAPLRVASPEPGAERALPSMFAVPQKKKSPIVPISIAAGVVIVAVAAFLVMRNTGSSPAPAATPTAAPTSTTAAPAPLAAATTSSAQPQAAGVPAAAPAAAQPAIDPAQVDAEVQKRLGAERARLQQQMQPVSAPPSQQQNAAASRPAVITPAPVAVAPPSTETRAAAPQPAAAAPQPTQPAPQPAQPAPQPAPEAPRVREGDLVAAGTEGLVAARITRRATPTYPPIARMQRVEGTVVVNVLVSERGEVLDTRILSGVKRNVGLNEAALQAIRKSSFAPGTKDGVRVKSWTAVEVDFKL